MINQQVLDIIDHLTAVAEPKFKQLELNFNQNQSSNSNIVKFPTPHTQDPTPKTPFPTPEISKPIQWYRKFFWRREIPIAKIREWGGGDCRRKATYIKAFAYYTAIIDVEASLTLQPPQSALLKPKPKSKPKSSKSKSKSKSKPLQCLRPEIVDDFETGIDSFIPPSPVPQTPVPQTPAPKPEPKPVLEPASEPASKPASSPPQTDVNNNIIQFDLTNILLRIKKILCENFENLLNDIELTIKNDDASIVCSHKRNKLSMRIVGWQDQLSISYGQGGGSLAKTDAQIVDAIDYYFVVNAANYIDEINSEIEKEEKANEGDIVLITSRWAKERRGLQVEVSRRNHSFIWYWVDNKEYAEQDGGYEILEACW